VLLIGPDGADLVVRMRRRGAAFHFDGPTIRFAGLLAEERESSPLELVVQLSADAACATVNGARACAARMPAGSIRELLRPSTGAGMARNLLDAVALAALMLPAALLLPSVSRVEAFLAGLLLVGGSTAAAQLAGLGRPSALEYLGLLTGLVAGVLVNRLVTRAAPRAMRDLG
jgi:hypothetical protein